MIQPSYHPTLLQIVHRAQQLAQELRHAFVAPEHFLKACIITGVFDNNFDTGAVKKMLQQLETYLQSALEARATPEEEQPEHSYQWEIMAKVAQWKATSAQAKQIDVPHYISAIYQLEDSWGQAALQTCLGEEADVLTALLAEKTMANSEEKNTNAEESEQNKSHAMVLCINGQLSEHNPLIGRETELERTIRVLCRRDKNNPIHVGDPGVGKTALIYGLAAKIEAGEVPPRLHGCKIYAIDMGTMLAGTQYRGDFEKRLKAIVEEIAAEGNGIIYIDEIHTLVGAGRIGDGSLDAANLLKPYLETGRVRFVGATTHEEYNRYFAGSGALTRRFQTIDIPEPTITETCRILEGLQTRYEEFHGIHYDNGTIEHAVRMADRYITDRRLPDKAIDLIDEAAAYREVHPDGTNRVDRRLIDQILAGICKVDSLRDIEAEDTETLKHLQPEMLCRIFGQDEAIRKVAESIMISRAGLYDPDKPVASLLFVGPTGVGKTEVAKVLATQLGIELLRFDMSEYAEKHTVARLIGAPAGYVGYEDGGLLTDAVRRTPHCVLLLDEIEKAHPDIFNLLLQVMDRATLTDTRGRTADFRHVVLIMTSNAGAQFARQAGMGFDREIAPGKAMLHDVKRLFKPEFLNRLTATVVFNEMSQEMARRILHKKTAELQKRLLERNVVLNMTEEAVEYLLRKGFTREYGAREIDRVISAELKPLLTRALLFGTLKQGGTATIVMKKNALELEAEA